MPELPEVETIARQLRNGGPTHPPLPGRRIDQVTVRWPRHIATPPAPRFREAIAGRTIRDVDRRGKYLVFPLDRGTLLIHLKMTGDLGVVRSGEPSGPYDHTIFHLDQGWDLRFGDARKFGKVFLLEDPGEVLTAIGPEPLSPGFTARQLQERLRGRSRPLKPLLLDQAFLAGMGNIYVDEALHRAGLHPLRRSDTLRDDEVHRLWRAIRAALRAGLRHNGASLDWVYRGGEFQNHFRVYGRAGEPCPVCRTAIRRIVVGQRGTHFCPTCQPRRRRAGAPGR
jgi:formamidopyrimidine-DNA glycosylase